MGRGALLILLIHILISLFLAYLGLELALYWVPLIAVHQHPPDAVIARRPPDVWQPTKQSRYLPETDKIATGRRGDPRDDINAFPRFILLSACRDGEECIPGLAKSFHEQDYPPDRVRYFLVADNCTDHTADVARAYGFEVYERHDLAKAGKGNAISDILQNRLRYESFDIVLIVDVDARMDSSFLRRTVRYFSQSPLVISCATIAKNPDQTLLSRVGNMIQGLLRLHQQGRSALGLDAILYGSHGYALSRKALECLGWHTTTGQIAEDMELRLRCRLQGIPIQYAPDLSVLNDVTESARAVHDQRRRWNSTYLPLIVSYTGPFLKRWLRGESSALDDLFGVLLLPSFANLFLYLSLMALSLSISSIHAAFLRPYAAVAGLLWATDMAYFLAAFSQLHVHLGWQELKGLGLHLALRMAALLESLFFVHIKVWPPAPHKKD